MIEPECASFSSSFPFVLSLVMTSLFFIRDGGITRSIARESGCQTSPKSRGKKQKNSPADASAACAPRVASRRRERRRPRQADHLWRVVNWSIVCPGELDCDPRGVVERASPRRRERLCCVNRRTKLSSLTLLAAERLLLLQPATGDARVALGAASLAIV